MINVRSALLVAGLGAVTALSLSACTFNAGPTIEPDDLAGKVATSLAEAVGSDVPPNIDCGEDTIFPKVGESVTCLLSVDGEDDTYDVTVTFDEIDGTDLSFSSVVADEPN